MAPGGHRLLRSTFAFCILAFLSIHAIVSTSKNILRYYNKFTSAEKISVGSRDTNITIKESLGNQINITDNDSIITRKESLNDGSNANSRDNVVARNESVGDGNQMYFNEAMRQFPTASESDIQALKEQTRFVLFLCSQQFFNGALALVKSLAESAQSTLLPPIVIVAGSSILRPSQPAILEALGAQVLVVQVPDDLEEAMTHQVVSRRYQGVFNKMLLFRREIVQCDIVFYIDVDAVVRGDVIRCMSGLLEYFRSKPELELMALGSRTYFNNGVMLARPSKSTYSYMVEMLRNGTCKGNCTEIDYETQMKRRIGGDQEIFIEYTERFPERFQPIHKSYPFNLRPMHEKDDAMNSRECAVVHFAGLPKPWNAWLLQEKNSTLNTNQSIPLSRLPEYFPQSMLKEKERMREKWQMPLWAIGLWRDVWNDAMDQLRTSNANGKDNIVTRNESVGDEFFNGALALIKSLAESARSTLLPPLVIVAGSSILRPSQPAILEALGAQVRVVQVPDELEEVMTHQVVSRRYQGVFNKMLLFRREMVQCDIVFYIDVDAIVRGDVIRCMSGLLEYFRSKPELELMALGSRTYFNNGVMLARPSKSTCSYPFNLRPIHVKDDAMISSECGASSLCRLSEALECVVASGKVFDPEYQSEYPLSRLPEYFSRRILNEKERMGKKLEITFWAVGPWRDVWNDARDQWYILNDHDCNL